MEIECIAVCLENVRFFTCSAEAYIYVFNWKKNCYDCSMCIILDL